jgi:hypothetical protein
MINIIIAKKRGVFMKKIVFTVAGRRLEVELDDSFAEYLSNDLAKNNISLKENNELTQLFQIYLKSLQREYYSEEQIKILMNKMEGLTW